MKPSMFAWEVAASLVAGLIVLYVFEQHREWKNGEWRYV